MNLYIDYGGTHFRYQINDEPVVALPSQNTHLLEFLENIIEEKGIKNIGISFAGQVCEGKIISAPNINLANLNIKQYIEAKYGVVLEIDNDLKCATLYESSLFPQFKNLCVIYIGTGVGSGLIINHQLVRGKNNFAGELGHIPFRKTPFVCGCSRDDCLELSLGGKALKHWCEHYELDENHTNLELLLSTAKGKAIYDNFEKALEHCFFTMLNLFDCEAFIFGGGVMQNNPQLLKNLKKSYEKSAFRSVRNAPEIFLSSSNNGSLEGAKILLQQKGNRL